MNLRVGEVIQMSGRAPRIVTMVLSEIRNYLTKCCLLGIAEFRHKCKWQTTPQLLLVKGNRFLGFRDAFEAGVIWSYSRHLRAYLPYRSFALDKWLH